MIHIYAIHISTLFIIRTVISEIQKKTPTTAEIVRYYRERFHPSFHGIGFLGNIFISKFLSPSMAQHFFSLGYTTRGDRYVLSSSTMTTFFQLLGETSRAYFTTSLNFNIKLHPMPPPQQTV